MKQVQILSIDAWRNTEGWEWNNWFKVGTFDLDENGSILDSPRKLFRWMRENGYLSEGSKGNVMVEDDQFNIVIADRCDGRPLYAIAYGEAQD